MEDVAPFIDQIKAEKDIFSKAKLLDHLIYKKDKKIKDIAKLLNMQPSYVCHILRLVRIPEMIVDGYYSDLISSSHLFVISRLKDKELMTQVYEKILNDNLTVIQTEEIVRDILHGIKTEGEHIDKDTKESFIKKIISDRTDLKLRIIQTRIKATVILEIKGNLTKTTKVLKKFIEKMKGWRIDDES
jgi:hypothetical protein